MKQTTIIKHQPAGRHAVVSIGEPRLRVGVQATVDAGAPVFDTLTAARKAAKSGQCVVRIADGIVVSVK